MALSAGARLGPYEIIEKIGAGGMGDVYRANDPRPNREVAVKVSAERFTDRFEREARAVASLNHPRSCTAPAQIIWFMELVDGETFAERINRGVLPPDEALAVARHIVDGLEAAHEKRIVHPI